MRCNCSEGSSQMAISVGIFMCEFQCRGFPLVKFKSFNQFKLELTVYNWSRVSDIFYSSLIIGNKMQEPNLNRRLKFLDRISSAKNLQLKQEPKPHKNVKFTQEVVESSNSRKKHHSASILKKRDMNSLQKAKQRSDSLNSMASQGPLDDQSCENSNLNKALKQQYFNFLQMAKKKGKFSDQFFPPVMSSIFSYAARKINKHPNVKWMRIPEVFPSRELVVTNPSGSKVQIKPSTNLSAQFFSLALNTLKSSKSYLKKVFEDQKVNQLGIYYAKIFQNNVWKYVIVDDSIPVLQGENGKAKAQPVFLTVEQNSQPLQIWPFILEKALAKYYSSYEALQTGNIFDFMQELTNKSCELYDLENSQEDLKAAFNNLDSVAFGQTKQSTKIPIVVGIGQSQKLSFVLQNKLRMIVSPDQLAKYFRKIYITGSKNYTYIGQCPIRQMKESISVRQFSLKSQGFCSITLNQKDKKHFQEPIKYSYCWIRILLIQKQFNGSYRWIDGRYDNQKTITIETQLSPGVYEIILMPEWYQRSYDLTLIIRSKVPVRMQRRQYEQGMIQQACADLAQRYGRLNQLNTYICSYNCIHEDMGLIIENINNERVKGQIKIVRSIDGLRSKVAIEAVNKEFQKQKSIQVIIKNNCHYTVVLKMKGGIDREFFKTFDFGGR